MRERSEFTKTKSTFSRFTRETVLGAMALKFLGRNLRISFDTKFSVSFAKFLSKFPPPQKPFCMGDIETSGNLKF